MTPDMTWIPQGYTMDIAGIPVLHIKSDVSNKIQHNMLPNLMYPCIIDSNQFEIQSTNRKTR